MKIFKSALFTAMIVLFTTSSIAQLSEQDVIRFPVKQGVLELSVISKAQFENAKQIIASINYLDFADSNNCEARAHWQIWELLAARIPSGFVSIDGDLERWAYHVATVVMVEGDKEPQIFDRAVAPAGPVAFSEWVKLITVTEKWSAWGGSNDEPQTLDVLNHYCSVVENHDGEKQISGIDDEDLSLQARRVFQGLKALGKINWPEGEQFTCIDQGLDWM